MRGENQSTYLSPLNPIFRSIKDYVSSLSNKVKVILGYSWQLGYKTYTYSEGNEISIFLVTPENIQISSRIELRKYCDLMQIDQKKIGFLKFHVWQTNSKTGYNNCFIVEIADTPMQRALEGLKAKKWLLNQLQ